MGASHSEVSWGFFLPWALATLLGVVVGFFVFFIAASLLGETLEPFNPYVAASLGFLIYACSFGTVTGVAQWSVLRRYVQRSAVWIGATVLGFLISSPVLLLPGGGFGPIIIPMTSLCMTAALGCALGVAQWFAIRKRVSKSVLWIGISFISWLIAGLIGRALTTLSWQMGPILYWLGLFFFGTVLSAIGMMWLFKKKNLPADIQAA